MNKACDVFMIRTAEGIPNKGMNSIYDPDEKTEGMAIHEEIQL